MVRRLAARPADATDGQLLGRFAEARDESAFAELVRRHGGPVLGVARRRLGDAHAADDVFQATFLILARRAARIDRHRPLGPWLYAVAYHLAVRAGAAEARRRRLERLAPPAASADPLAEVSGRELVGLIDTELNRLPEKYRHPLVLCGLQGLTRDEAARQLGWSAGAVKGRLERGRELLRARLARRGLALSAALVGSLLAPSAAPAELVRATLSALSDPSAAPAAAELA